MLSKPKYSKTESIATIIVLLFFLIFVIKSIGFVSINIGSYLMVIIGFFGHLFCLICKSKTYHLISKKNISLYIFIVVFIIIGIVSSSISGNLEIGEQLWPVVYSGISLLLINYKLNSRYVKFALLFICSYLILLAVIGVQIEQYMRNLSPNNISIFLLCFLSLYYISGYENMKKYKLFPAVVVLLITVWTTSRTGVAAVAALCVGLIFIKQEDNRYKVRNVFYSVVALGVFLIISLYIIETFLGSSYETLMNLGLDNGARENIWREYFALLGSPSSIIFGGHIKTNYYFINWNGNLHSSYLNLHARYGLLGLIFVLAYLIKTFLRLIKEKNYMFLIICIALLLRASLDEFCFNGLSDPILYYFIFGSYTQINNCKESNRRSLYK